MMRSEVTFFMAAMLDRDHEPTTAAFRKNIAHTLAKA
jgi:hypothetical protein